MLYKKVLMLEPLPLSIAHYELSTLQQANLKFSCPDKCGACLQQDQEKYEEYRTLWQSIFTVFNVAAAGEYDTETYLKVGLLLADKTQLLSSWRCCVLHKVPLILKVACPLQTHFPLATATLLCLFLFVVTVMLFNVLIALLTNASQKVRHFCARVYQLPVTQKRGSLHGCSSVHLSSASAVNLLWVGFSL